MPIPPKYGDLGKSARDLFGKNYHFGLWKLDAKHQTESQVKFNTVLTTNSDSGKVAGSLETKYNWKDYGLTFTEKWDTDNVINTELAVEDQLLQGLKLSFDTSFQPSTGKKGGRINTSYKRDYVNASGDVDFDFAGPTVHGTCVVGHKGWLAGYQMAFDTAKSKLVRNNVAVGYQGQDFSLHANCDEGRNFGGSLYHRVTKDLEAAVNMTWASAGAPTRFGVATKYRMSDDTSVAAKVSNQSQVGLSIIQKLSADVSCTASALIDAKNLNAGGHKVGVCLTMGQ